MAAPQSQSNSPLRVLEEALGTGLAAAGDTEDAEAAEGAYYLEQVTITETSEDDYEYEEIPDDNFTIPEGEEDLARAIQIVQEQITDTQILEQQTVLRSRHAVPEVIEDFLCNFLIKMGMTRTLDCFQFECKAREDLQKTQKERDFHRMHHKRVVQEKNKLINDLKELKLHYASYAPTIRVLHEKHHALLKEKMLASLERDRAVGKISRLHETLKGMEGGLISYIPEIKVHQTCEKENTPQGPTQKDLHEAREQNKCKTKKKDNTKASFDRNQEAPHKLRTRSALCPRAAVERKLTGLEWAHTSAGYHWQKIAECRSTQNKTTHLQHISPTAGTK
ncbi:sperm-associated antigen 16 protein isoform X6 [Heterocephalus glaber]|uniref:Sperm-associated antigen 16 protein isoform X6 n=1 Tax=Heterocephalus glaber TaxID=10181 RepID=A0AAX6TB94_HETGA|nr:sperm-associated antigen 16 protein isoform X6 [Heterocephalus glaber]